MSKHECCLIIEVQIIDVSSEITSLILA